MVTVLGVVDIVGAMAMVELEVWQSDFGHLSGVHVSAVSPCN